LDNTELAEDDISQFKRIRLISKKNRIKYPTGPFSYQDAGQQFAMDPTSGPRGRGAENLARVQCFEDVLRRQPSRHTLLSRFIGSEIPELW
jgi:hypothetical protein